ncbi:amidase family protein [Catenuloplanes indicus]|uniref:Asp-tRNA(Asn)/Glu-tRNA(Gln) amidotransferase A subunit family amidase n=1 Tax=Catenuloplanes indicus TaxID=137267 RepID=A0AAE3VVA4_9ACTN|nr:amidase family protein [Catenuloplanes indicus]MDQ0364476.1 Asp-tRNA(Asn)/Glu-tRNA(Gln) amidotransferase A subunit family amidase [Catenuloplanes indicus]
MTDGRTGPAAALAARVRAGVRTATEVVEEALDAAARLDPVLHFLASLDAAGARAAAARLVPTGPLAGVPFLIKSGTSPDAPIVTRLVAAGAIPIGVSTRARPGSAAQTHGWNGTDHTRNPWDLTRSSGGSSAGAAAAVAAGVVPIATGGDSGGSLRIPAAFCGVTGVKGTAGRIPRSRPDLGGLLTPGIIGADLSDVVTATAIASGPHRRDPSALPVWTPPAAGGTAREWRVAYLPGLGGVHATPELDAVVRSRLVVPGIEVAAEALELLPVADAWAALYAAGSGAAEVPGPALRAAAEVRHRNAAALADLFESVDALVTPVTLTVAHGFAGPPAGPFVGDPCWHLNVTGNPAVSVPAGLAAGLPAGLQVVAAHGRDDIAVTVAALLTAPLPRPPVHA